MRFNHNVVFSYRRTIYDIYIQLGTYNIFIL